MATVLITGGTGMIGQALTKALVEKGHGVIILTRKAKPSTGAVQYKEWNVEEERIDSTAIGEADYIVHLAGANVADGRWTDKRKGQIVDSRVKSGSLLVKALSETPNNVKAVISASAIGWYGPDVPGSKPFVETDAADDSFLGQTSVQWEGAIRPVEQLGKRLVIFRIGIVLSNKGGAYAEFKKPLAFGAATVLGNGQQVVSWVHIHDLVQLFVMAIENEGLHGVYNAVAPQPVTNRELMKAIAKQKGGFHITLPVPSFALKIALGEMSVEVLKSATVSNQKIEATGFRFAYPTIASAVQQLQNEG